MVAKTRFSLTGTSLLSSMTSFEFTTLSVAKELDTLDSSFEEYGKELLLLRFILCPE